MKKIGILSLILVLILMVSSCTIDGDKIGDKVVAPINNIPPIQGKWVIEELVSEGYTRLSEEAIEDLIGKEALFHKEAIVLGEEHYLEPVYRTKTVGTEDYLLYKYKKFPSDLGIENKEVQIITISSKEQYLRELIQYKEDEMLTNINDQFFILRKTVDQVSIDEINRYITVEKNVLRSSNYLASEDLESGILIGFKSPVFDEINQTMDWKYKTLYIKNVNQRIESMYEIDNLLVPRNKGFWMVHMDREVYNGGIKDKLVAVSQGEEKQKKAMEEDYMTAMIIDEELEITKEFPSILKNIVFVGNDYISVETTELDANNKQTLQIIPIDNIEENLSIKLSDLIGEEGKNIMRDGAKSVITLTSDINLDERNIGLDRRNGYWILKGRVNFKQNEEELYKDFNIKAIPPKEMVSYDELLISWNEIKSKIPNAIDVFSSPAEDIAIVVTNNSLLIYPIVEGNLGKRPLNIINLEYDEQIIMAEWAIGRYIDLWEQVVIKNQGLKLDES